MTTWFSRGGSSKNHICPQGGREGSKNLKFLTTWFMDGPQELVWRLPNWLLPQTLYFTSVFKMTIHIYLKTAFVSQTNHFWFLNPLQSFRIFWTLVSFYGSLRWPRFEFEIEFFWFGFFRKVTGYIKIFLSSIERDFQSVQFDSAWIDVLVSFWGRRILSQPMLNGSILDTKIRKVR